MILQALNELYDRLKQDTDYNITEPGFSIQSIAFAIVVDKDGQVVDIQDIRQSSDRGRKPQPLQLRVLGGNKPSGSGLNPTLLWDTVGYLLGWRKKNEKEDMSENDRKKEDKDQERVEASHRASQEYHDKLQTEINDEGFSAVCKFFAQWKPEDVENKYPFITGLVGGYGVFKLLGDTGYVHDRPTIQKWYESSLPATVADTANGYSLLSGKKVAVAQLHDQIKGIGARAASLVSFNNSAYVSYGKEQSFNAPVSKNEAFRYATALNALTNGPMRKRHMIGMGDGNARVSVVFWARKKDDFEEMFSLMLGGGSDENVTAESGECNDKITAEEIRTAFQQLRAGKMPTGELDIKKDTDFYILGLSVNVTRVVVRFFIRSSIGVIMDNFCRHFRDMELDSPGKNVMALPSVKQILEQTCPVKENAPDREKIPANLEGLLFRSILLGTPYPTAVYRQILRRMVLDNRGDRGDFYKVAFIKAFLIRNHGKEFQMSLNVELADPGYLCGRMFAVLEKTQRDALGETNSTVRESYMASASARPGSVFPRLFKMYTHHLAKLEPGRKIGRELVMQEIMSKIGALPTTLNYTQQGAFFIGFYQQMQTFYTKKSDTGTAESDTPETPAEPN